MRVLIDASYVRRAPRSGTAVYIERLCEALARTGEVDVVQAVDEGRRPAGGGGLSSLRNATRDAWWTSLELPRRARAAGAALIHHPLPARALGCGIPQVVTVHDLAFERCPEDFDPVFRAYARVAHRAAARRAAAVVAVSHTTAADLEGLWGVRGPGVFVARHGPGQFAQPPVEAGEAAASPPSHFLYVGDAEPRKDLATLRAAHARYREQGGPLPLRLAGAAGERVSGPRLRELFGGAAALVHPARYEGFGLTVLEAMACGVPVIGARCAALAEVAGGAARTFPPGDVDELVRLLWELGDSEAVRAELAAAGRRQAATFSWAESAQRHLAAYSWALRR